MTATRLTVDPENSEGSMRRVWASIGYDELNWTYTTRGKALHRLLGSEVFTKGPYWVRMHNTFTSGNELSTPAWGAGNPYHEMSDGSVRYRWEPLDKAFDAIIESGGIPLVELGFMPKDLSRFDPDVEGTFDAVTPAMLEYELGAWRYPPKDLGKWTQLVHDFVRHVVERYGEEHVRQWRFELWNEPNIDHYWRGSVSEYCALFEASYEGAKSALHDAQVGGPATTDKGMGFLDEFLSHLRSKKIKPDFLSFHTKGAYFTERRAYTPFVEVDREAPSTSKMVKDIENSLEIIAKYPEYNELPVYIDECDPAVGTIFGVFDNPNFVVANSEYYASFVCQLAGKLLDNRSVTLFTHWAFLFEGKRWFEGNRTLVDNENVEKPILNGLRMLEWLAGGERISVKSDSESVGGLASRFDDKLCVLVWNHEDEWWSRGTASVELVIESAISNGQASITRVDQEHGNTFRAWESLGSPQDPKPEEVELMRNAGKLAAETILVSSDGSRSRVTLDVPVHGLAFLELG